MTKGIRLWYPLKYEVEKQDHQIEVPEVRPRMAATIRRNHAMRLLPLAILEQEKAGRKEMKITSDEILEKIRDCEIRGAISSYEWLEKVIPELVADSKRLSWLIDESCLTERDNLHECPIFLISTELAVSECTDTRGEKYHEDCRKAIDDLMQEQVGLSGDMEKAVNG